MHLRTPLANMPRITDFFPRKLSVNDQVAPLKKSRTHETNHDTKKEQTQTYLDLGQKNLSQKTCKDCGMCYDSSFKEDIQRHKSFHNGYLTRKNRIFLSSPIEDKIKIDDYTCVIYGPPNLYLQSTVNQLNDFMEAANIDLGSESYHIYYIVDDENEVLSMAVVERIQEAYYAEEYGQNSPITVSTETKTASTGISRIWTSEKHRSKGLAKKLLDVIRQTYARPLVISKKLVAFSQPTQEGFALASSYQKDLFPNGKCLIYK